MRVDARLRMARAVREACCHLLLHRAHAANRAAFAPELLGGKAGPPGGITLQTGGGSPAGITVQAGSGPPGGITLQLGGGPPSGIMLQTDAGPAAGITLQLGSLACVPPLLLFAPQVSSGGHSLGVESARAWDVRIHTHAHTDAHKHRPPRPTGPKERYEITTPQPRAHSPLTCSPF